MKTAARSRPRPDTKPDSDIEDAIEQFKHAVLAKLTFAVGKDAGAASDRDWFVATTLSLRDRVIHRWLERERETLARGRKRIYYLSLEFLIGRLLNDVAGNLQHDDIVRERARRSRRRFRRVRFAEPDAALGNGGLGRLAACFMESMATLGIPAYGYGIRYEQRPVPPDRQGWLAAGISRRNGCPSPIRGSSSDREVTYDIGFGGWVETAPGRGNHTRLVWHPEETIEAVAYDTPVVGWRGNARQPAAPMVGARGRPAAPRCLQRGDHVGALPSRRAPRRCRKSSIRATRPRPAGTAAAAGIFLRLRLAAGPRAAPSPAYGSLYTLAEQAAIQLNDTHPSIAVAELMRILIDIHACAGTRPGRSPSSDLSLHQPHAAARGARNLAGDAVRARAAAPHADHLPAQRPPPRSVAQQAAADAEVLAARLADRRARWPPRAHGAPRLSRQRTRSTASRRCIRGLVSKTLFRDLNALYPDRIVNVTNGITFRRWLYRAPTQA